MVRTVEIDNFLPSIMHWCNLGCGRWRGFSGGGNRSVADNNSSIAAQRGAKIYYKGIIYIKKCECRFCGLKDDKWSLRKDNIRCKKINRKGDRLESDNDFDLRIFQKIKKIATVFDDHVATCFGVIN